MSHNVHSTVPVIRLPFEPGLKPYSGDVVYLLPNAIATCRHPDEAWRGRIWLVRLGILRSKTCMRVGFVVDASSYDTDQTCMVALV